MSTVNEPLRALLGKDVEFVWESSQDKCFRKLKELVCNAPVLRFYDLNKPVTVSVDASGFSLGACILQDNQPVAYAAKSLTEGQKKLCTNRKRTPSYCFWS